MQPIQRHAQNYDHITQEKWEALGPDFEKAEAVILKKIEKGEYEKDFGDRLMGAMKKKYEGKLNNSAGLIECIEKEGSIQHLARVDETDVTEILQAIVSNEIPRGRVFEATLEENGITSEEFFKSLSLIMRRGGESQENIQAWINLFKRWGYGPEVAWLEATLDPTGEQQAPAPQAPRQQQAPPATPRQQAPAPQQKAPETSKPEEKPEAGPQDKAPEKGKEQESVSGRTIDTDDKSGGEEQMKKLFRYPWGHDARRYKLIVERKDTKKKQFTENVQTPRGMHHLIKQFTSNPVFRIVDIQDLGPGDRRASMTGWKRFAQTEESIDQFKAGTPVIFTRDVELTFDALNAKGAIKENMTGKVKKVLDDSYMIDIAGQIYLVPKNAADHVMDIFVGEVVGEQPDADIEMDDQVQAPNEMNPQPQPQQQAPGQAPAGVLGEETVEIPPNALQPGASSSIGMGRRAMNTEIINPTSPTQSPPGKANFCDLNREVEEQDISRRNIEDKEDSHSGKPMQRDTGEHRGPAGLRASTDQMASLLKTIENGGPYVVSDMGRRLYHAHGATKEGMILPIEGRGSDEK